MDPLSVCASAAGLLTICVQAVQIIKTTIETLRSAKEFLLKLLSQTERVRLFLEQLRSLSKQLGHRSEILLAYNDSGPRETINELNAFVRKMAQNTTWVRLKVLLRQNEADKLVERLHRHEEEIMQVLLSIATASSIRTESDIKRIYETVTRHAQVSSPFSSSASTLVDAPGALMDKEENVHVSKQPNRINSSSQVVEQVQIWFGDLSRDGFSNKYLAMRDDLADFAFSGDFEKVFQVLTDVQKQSGQSWVNASRLTDRTSGFTPLHQAVYTGATKEDITRLVQEFGALRLLRTVWTDPEEFLYRNMTAADIAREIGYTEVLEILAPRIYHTIPHDVLATLRTHFHSLICEDVNETSHLRLPDLDVLTELKEPLMWFPLKPSPPNRIRGYIYRLDGRELLVQSFGVSVDGSTKLYRISEKGALEIEEAITFSHA